MTRGERKSRPDAEDLSLDVVPHRGGFRRREVGRSAYCAGHQAAGDILLGPPPIGGRTMRFAINANLRAAALAVACVLSACATSDPSSDGTGGSTSGSGGTNAGSGGATGGATGTGGVVSGAGGAGKGGETGSGGAAGHIAGTGGAKGGSSGTGGVKATGGATGTGGTTGSGGSSVNCTGSLPSGGTTHS